MVVVVMALLLVMDGSSSAEIVDFLRDRSRYVAIGAKLPKGILLSGEEGRGRERVGERAVLRGKHGMMWAVVHRWWWWWCRSVGHGQDAASSRGGERVWRALHLVLGFGLRRDAGREGRGQVGEQLAQGCCHPHHARLPALGPMPH